MNLKKKEIVVIKMRKLIKKKCIICVSVLFGMRIFVEIGINYFFGKKDKYIVSMWIFIYWFMIEYILLLL